MSPFGLQSAPKIFNAVADVLHWHLHRAGIQFIRHYLDDYITIAPTNSNQRVYNLQLLLRESRRLGVPVAAHKTCGPIKCLTFLGIERKKFSDLAWWQSFLHQWNGVSFLLPPFHLPQAVLTTDASGCWGAGAWHQTSWFQIQWDQHSQSLSIVVKELIPIILACHTWGTRWEGQQVICLCDNLVVVACLHCRTSKDETLMHLL